jgi:hypothetical protein
MKKNKAGKDVVLPRMTRREVATLWLGLRIIRAIICEDVGGARFTRENLLKMEHLEKLPLLPSAQIDRLAHRLKINLNKIDQRIAALKKAKSALRGDSNDEEHDALHAMVEAFKKDRDLR